MEMITLLHLIEERFKNELPVKVPSQEEIARLIGQQDVVEFIKSILHLEIEEDSEYEK